MNRRKFIKNTALTSAGIAIGSSLANCKNKSTHSTEINALTTGANVKSKLPLVIATWSVKEATAKAMEVLDAGGNALDAVEQGCKIEEANEKGQSVGKGGLPDRDGNVTLDACIMDETGNCGSISFIKNIKHPISVARKVMDTTPHVMLSGEGALQFALDNGFKKEDLLTEKAETRWKNWLESSEYKPIINVENHDTILLSMSNFVRVCIVKFF